MSMYLFTCYSLTYLLSYIINFFYILPRLYYISSHALFSRIGENIFFNTFFIFLFSTVSLFFVYGSIFHKSENRFTSICLPFIQQYTGLNVRSHFYLIVHDVRWDLCEKVLTVHPHRDKGDSDLPTLIQFYPEVKLHILSIIIDS